MGKSRKRHKASKPRKIVSAVDPSEKARQEYHQRHDPAQWGANRDALSLPQNGDVEIISPTRERVARIQRFDCFVTLGITVEQHQAVRRYQEQLAIRYGAEGSSRGGEHVDGASFADPVSPRSIKAAQDLERLAGLMEEPWMLPLIEALSLPTVLKGDRVNWKATVRVMFGLIDRGAQARIVKVAAEGVRRAWAEYDAGAAKKKAA